jgi:hypothetical protein
MAKKYPGGLFKTVWYVRLVLTGIVLLVLSGCEEEPVLSGEKNIIEFKIGNKRGAINQTDKTISVVVDAATDLTNLTPELIISSDASVYPGSLVPVDIRDPISYTVTAEDGTSQSYRVTVSYPANATVLDSLVIKAPPFKTVYELYESFDPTGLAIIGLYSDGSSKEENQYALSEPDTTTEGTKTVEVTIGSKNTSFNIKVRSGRLESITINKLPDTTTYGYGTEALDTTGLVVTGIYSDGSTESMENPAVSGFNGSRAGIQEILVSVNGKTVAFKVTVLPQKILESIAIVEKPAKVLYIPEEKGDVDELERLYDELLNGIIVTGTYSDGSTLIEELTQENIGGFNPDKSGPQTLRITVGDRAVTFIVDIVKLDYIEVAVKGKTIYLLNEAIDLSSFVIIGHYSDTTTKHEIITDANISGFNSSIAGAGQEVTVTVGGQKAYFTVNVYEETSLTINLASDLHIEVYGLPEVTQENPDQIISLSLGRKNGLSDMVVISTTSNFDSIKWTIDNKTYSTDNIIAIKAEDYTFGVHVIGFIGKRGQDEYSRTIKLSVTH